MNPIALIRAARLGASEIARRAAAGTLSPEARTLAMKGAERFLEAIAAGDIVNAEQHTARLRRCATCDSRVDEAAPGAWGASSWCGPALVDRLDQEDPTCGCLVIVKALVGSESCPQKRYTAITVRRGR